MENTLRLCLIWILKTSFVRQLICPFGYLYELPKVIIIFHGLKNWSSMKVRSWKTFYNTSFKSSLATNFVVPLIITTMLQSFAEWPFICMMSYTCLTTHEYLNLLSYISTDIKSRAATPFTVVVATYVVLSSMYICIHSAQDKSWNCFAFYSIRNTPALIILYCEVLSAKMHRK